MNQRSLTRRMSAVVTVVMCSAFYLFLLVPHAGGQYLIELDAHVTLDSFLVWYDQYKFECYADSTPHHESKWVCCQDSVLFNGRWEYDVVTWKDYTVWTHDRESTFDGFMSWLRRKQLTK